MAAALGRTVRPIDPQTVAAESVPSSTNRCGPVLVAFRSAGLSLGDRAASNVAASRAVLRQAVLVVQARPPRSVNMALCAGWSAPSGPPIRNHNPQNNEIEMPGMTVPRQLPTALMEDKESWLNSVPRAQHSARADTMDA
jgi:hypothetical protein